ncbi:hypothetical protein [Gracilimonas halophila]|uniref:Uncharacterized protein n=1 Tax=Gracilimonas halophila TaxID=1834464 RepID=A0ABW5JJ74_9BACT
MGFYAENVNGVSPNEIIHYGAPDEFKNQLGTPVFIHVKDKNGAKKPALLSSSSKADSVLKKDQKKKLILLYSEEVMEKR